MHPARLRPLARVCCVAFTAALWPPSGAWAQVAIPSSLSTFAGVVVDPSHAPVSGAAVVLEDRGRRVTRRVHTQQDGRFDAADLPAGDYEVEVVVPGFVPFREAILLAGPLVEREVVLSIGRLSERMTVRAGDEGSAAHEVSRTTVAPLTCTPAVDPTTRSPVGGQLRPPLMLHRVRPAFPAHLVTAEVDGVVRLDGRVTTDGTVGELTVAESSHPELAEAASDAVRAWAWEPPLLNCQPVEVEIDVTVEFISK